MANKILNQTFLALSLLFQNLKNNLADYLLLVGIILTGIFIYNEFGINPTILYGGVVCIVASFIFGFTTKPKTETRRNY